MCNWQLEVIIGHVFYCIEAWKEHKRHGSMLTVTLKDIIYFSLFFCCFYKFEQSCFRLRKQNWNWSTGYLMIFFRPQVIWWFTSQIDFFFSQIEMFGANTQNFIMTHVIMVIQESTSWITYISYMSFSPSGPSATINIWLIIGARSVHQIPC